MSSKEKNIPKQNFSQPPKTEQTIINNTLNIQNSLPILKKTESQQVPNQNNIDAQDKIDRPDPDQECLRRRMNSSHISIYPQLYLEENEDILLNISKKQKKLNNYKDQKESISFSEREGVISWCLSLLETVELSKFQKTSIFHRFCTAYDIIMGKLFILNKPIKEEKDLKILIITIFLLTYKLEGFALAKITISNLIEAFLTEVSLEKEKLIQKIAKNEMCIIELMDFNPQIFNDNNIHQISYMFLDLFEKKYSIKFNQEEEIRVNNAIDMINKCIEFSDRIVFKYFPIDKAMLSFYTGVEYCFLQKKGIVIDSLKKFNKYLRNNMKIIKLSKEDFDKFCLKFAKYLFKNKV